MTTIIYGPGGSVCSDTDLLAIGSHVVPDEHRDYYGGKYMLCETASEGFARWVARKLFAKFEVKP